MMGVKDTYAVNRQMVLILMQSPNPYRRGT